MPLDLLRYSTKVYIKGNLSILPYEKKKKTTKKKQKNNWKTEICKFLLKYRTTSVQYEHSAEGVTLQQDGKLPSFDKGTVTEKIRESYSKRKAIMKTNVEKMCREGLQILSP